MNCHELAELLLDYIAGELEAQLTEEVREHLCQCQCCITFVETYQITIRLSRQLPQNPLPLRILQRLEEELRKMQ